jgi:arylsulfatase A-like enzyme
MHNVSSIHAARRLRVFIFCAVMVIAAVTSACQPATAPAGDAPPNVVLIITDDQGYGDLAVHGNPVIKTPNLDSLHARSIRLTNFHVSPTCAPTRSALMTGRYTDSTGTWHTIMGRSLMNSEEVTLADTFQANGYRTGMFGKWHLGDNYPYRPHDRGFEEAFYHGGGGVWQTPDYFTNDYFDDTYYRNGVPEKTEGFCTDVWFDNAIDFIGRAKAEEKPFFAYITTNAPHGPMWAPENYEQMYEGVEGLKEPGFYGMITNIDDNIKKLVDYLGQNDLEENTIFIYMTDNGTSSGENVWNAGMRGKKGSPYEGGHRVPFFVYWPAGELVGPKDIDTLTAHIDVVPTLMELAGLKKPQGPEVYGKSLKPLLYGEQVEWPDRVFATDSQRLADLVKWKSTAVMSQQWRLVSPTIDGDTSKLELYDIQQDPGQENNVAATNPEVVAKLTAEYDAWWKLASARADEFSRIVIGNDADNPARLTCHDWVSDGAQKSWNQRGIRNAPAVNGPWMLEVEQAGKYRVELRRWPKEVDLPINAPYEDKEFNRETAKGVAINAVKARLKVGGFDESAAVNASDKGVSFEVELEAGPVTLETWLIGKDGTERGAYFVYVERL